MYAVNRYKNYKRRRYSVTNSKSATMYSDDGFVSKFGQRQYNRGDYDAYFKFNVNGNVCVFRWVETPDGTWKVTRIK